MAERPDWLCCVTRTKGVPGTGVPGLSWCGRQLWSYEWAFVDLDHARRTVELGQRLVPCEACMAAAAQEPSGG